MPGSGDKSTGEEVGLFLCIVLFLIGLTAYAALAPALGLPQL